MEKIIRIKADTCQICGRITDWDSSYGRENFIVCPLCYNDLRKKYDLSALTMLFTIADIRTKNMLDE